MAGIKRGGGFGAAAATQLAPAATQATGGGGKLPSGAGSAAPLAQWR
jgi:hypothetical protein